MTDHDWIARIAALEVRLAATESRLAAAEHRIACLENGYTPALQVPRVVPPVSLAAAGNRLGSIHPFPLTGGAGAGPMVDDRDHGPRFAVPDVPVQGDDGLCSVCGLARLTVVMCDTPQCPVRTGR